MGLETPISQFQMIGPIYTKRLAKLNIATIKDFLYHTPFRYDDYSRLSSINKVKVGEIITVKGQILSIKNEYTKNGKRIQKATVSDGTKDLEIIWFNQLFLTKTLKTGEWYNFSGKIEWFGRSPVLISPEYEKLRPDTPPIHTGRLVPVYPETYGLSSKWIRSRMAVLLELALPQIDEFLPEEILKKNNLIDLSKALRWIHFPPNNKEIELAKKRFSFNELFLIQLSSLQRKLDWKAKIPSFQFKVDYQKVSEFISQLPFQLTNAQKRCINEICQDLSKGQPMNRLLEGDVGSGKTVVAAVALYVSYLNGYQSALMAPTEILATQHYNTLNKLLLPLGVKVVLITSGVKQKEDKNCSADLVIGTHSLIYDRVNFNNLAFVAIDEQQRFGVEQRSKLAAKGKSPHILTMTATPIPRTVTLTLYGDLDLSIIDEMPTGRIQIKTWVVPPQKREAAYNWIKQKVKGTDEQAFIVCPLIEESETLQSIKAATVEFDILSKKVFPELKIGLLHGKLKSKEKEDIINKFRSGQLDILVSTPVVEVGIDIPQATIMMIEGAERFGLAQLHQLRGRVGRDVKESYCLLFTENTEDEVINRLKAMEQITLGMELAELDLKLRGPGEIYGTVQHGFINLKFASFTDVDLIQKTYEAASVVLDKIDQYPPLKEELAKYTVKSIDPN